MNGRLRPEFVCPARRTGSTEHRAVNYRTKVVICAECNAKLLWDTYFGIWGTDPFTIEGL